MLKLDDQLCFALYAASNAIMGAYQRPLSSMSLTYPQYLVMIALWQHGSASLAELAVLLRVDVDAVTPLGEQLEQSGYVYRVRTADDRQVRLVLTPMGVQLEEAATDAQRQVTCAAGMTEASMRVLRGELHQLIDRITLAPASSDRGDD